jgi:hypothetical protein
LSGPMAKDRVILAVAIASLLITASVLVMLWFL